MALGFLKVTDESMARPVRNLTEARGFETSRHHLASFGDAGGQHAYSVAATLGISSIIIHKYSSVLSTNGLALADVAQEVQVPVSAEYIPSQSRLRKRVEGMIAQSTVNLMGQGFQHRQISHQLLLNMRYEGSDTDLMILNPKTWDFTPEFKKRHRREFGFTFEKPILVDEVRVRSIVSSNDRAQQSPAA